MTPPAMDPDDPLFKPLTLAQVLEITGRSPRTIQRWINDHKLHPLEDPAAPNRSFEAAHRRRVIFDESEVVEVEKEMRDAASANRRRIAELAGRTGPRQAPDHPSGATDTPDVQSALDSEIPGVASSPWITVPETGPDPTDLPG